MSWFKRKEVWVIIILLTVVLINKVTAEIKMKYSSKGPEITLDKIHIPSKDELEEVVDEPNYIKVDISGAVLKPGVYVLEEGDRIQDVIKLGGGLTEEADINLVNQADYVHDGQKIIILRNGETKELVQGIISGPINLNTATKEQLGTLNGIGEKTAGKIIDYRTKNGSFETIEDLTKVNGIGDSKLDGIRGEIVVN